MKLRGMIAIGMFVWPGLPLEAQPVDFAREVRPIFERSCLGCHGPEKQKSGFRLDVRDIAIKGGESGERAIIHTMRRRVHSSALSVAKMTTC